MTNDEFRKTLAAALDNRLIRQVDIAKMLQVTRPTVSAWVNGTSNPSPERQAAILRLLAQTAERRGQPPSVISESAPPPYSPLSADIRGLFAVAHRIDSESLRLASIVSAVSGRVEKEVRNELLIKGMTIKEEADSSRRAAPDMIMIAPDGVEWGVEVKVIKSESPARIPNLPYPLLVVVALIEESNPLSFYSVPVPPLSSGDTTASRTVQVIRSMISGNSALFVGDTRYSLESVSGINLPPSAP